MSEDSESKKLALLQQIANNQELQIERQLEALEMQRQQFDKAMVVQQNAEKLQDRAETMQANAGKFIKIVMFLIIILVAAAVALVFL